MDDVREVVWDRVSIVVLAFPLILVFISRIGSMVSWIPYGCFETAIG